MPTTTPARCMDPRLSDATKPCAPSGPLAHPVFGNTWLCHMVCSVLDLTDPLFYRARRL